VSIVDDVRELFGMHAAVLNERLVGVENHLDAIRSANDRVAEDLDYELYQTKLVIPALTPKGFNNLANAKKFFEVPEGAWYELLGWTSLSAEAEIPLLLTNGTLFDMPNTYQTPKRAHKSTSQGMMIMPREWFEAINLETESETVLWVLFKIYKRQPRFVADTGSGG